MKGSRFVYLVGDQPVLLLKKPPTRVGLAKFRIGRMTLEPSWYQSRSAQLSGNHELPGSTPATLNLLIKIVLC